MLEIWTFITGNDLFFRQPGGIRESCRKVTAFDEEEQRERQFLAEKALSAPPQSPGNTFEPSKRTQENEEELSENERKICDNLSEVM